MIVLGLTGGIGMGKSTVARMFADKGVPVWDADATVHSAYQNNTNVRGFLRVAFPQVWVGGLVDGHVDRAILREVLFRDKEAMQALNWTMKQFLEQQAESFIAYHEVATMRPAAIVLLDVPLLYEGGLDKKCDYVVSVSCPEAVQRDRVLARPGMTEAAYQEFVSRQMSDNSRCAKADFVIDTSLSLESVERRVMNVISGVLSRASEQ